MATNERKARVGRKCFHVTAREKYAVVIHIGTSAVETAAAQERQRSIVSSLDLGWMMDLAMGSEGPGLDKFSSSELSDVEMSDDEIDGLLDACTADAKRPMRGFLSHVLGGLTSRLKDVKRGTYVDPREASATASSRADGGTE